MLSGSKLSSRMACTCSYERRRRRRRQQQQVEAGCVHILRQPLRIRYGDRPPQAVPRLLQHRLRDNNLRNSHIRTSRRQALVDRTESQFQIRREAGAWHTNLARCQISHVARCKRPCGLQHMWGEMGGGGGLRHAWRLITSAMRGSGASPQRLPWKHTRWAALHGQRARRSAAKPRKDPARNTVLSSALPCLWFPLGTCVQRSLLGLKINFEPKNYPTRLGVFHVLGG